MRQGADRVGAVGDGVRPALADDVPAQVLFAEIPRRQPVAPLEHLVAGNQTRQSIASQTFGEDQGGETAAEDRVGAVLAEADDHEPGGHPVAQPGQEVVVDATLDPGGQSGVRRAVAD